MSVNITDNTKEFKQAMAAAIPRALEAVGLQAEGYAKALCPVDTGNLRKNITHMQEGEHTEAIGTNVEYAPYVELGTQRSKAQPFLKPAAGGHNAEYLEIIKSCLTE